MTDRPASRNRCRTFPSPEFRRFRRVPLQLACVPDTIDLRPKSKASIFYHAGMTAETGVLGRSALCSLSTY